MSTTKKRTIRFDYYFLTALRGETEDKSDDITTRFDLSALFTECVKADLSERLHVTSKHVPIRMESVNLREDLFWEINLLKYRTELLPSAATYNKPKSDVSLEDDEYISEDMNILFSVRTKAFMVQRSKYCLSPSEVCTYLSMEWRRIFGENISFMWSAITNDVERRKMLRSNRHRSAHIRFDIVNDEVDEKRPIADFAKAARLYAATEVEVVIKEKIRERSLENGTIRQLIEDINKNQGDYTIAQFQFYDDSLPQVQNYDLLANSLRDYIIVQVEPRTTLRSEYVFSVMREKYAEREGYILNH